MAGSGKVSRENATRDSFFLERSTNTKFVFFSFLFHLFFLARFFFLFSLVNRESSTTKGREQAASELQRLLLFMHSASYSDRKGAQFLIRLFMDYFVEYLIFHAIKLLPKFMKIRPKSIPTSSHV